MDSPAPPPPDPPPPPGSGYQVPPRFGALPPGPGQPEYDPLVPPPNGGLQAIWDRLTATLRRSGQSLALIMLLTVALPQIAVTLAFTVALEGLVTTAGGVAVPLDEDSASIALGFGLLGGGVAATVILAFVAALGWGAGIWAVTEAAAGRPVRVGDALVAGGRRLLPMTGWYLLYVLMVLAGVVACLVPGIYLAMSGALFSFAVVYERGRGAAMARSFGLLHRAFSMALGRILLLFLFMLLAQCLVALCTSLVTGFAAGPDSTGGAVFANVVTALALVPINMIMLVGLLLTYAQLRAREEPLSTGQLWAAANQDPAGGGPPGYPGYPGGPGGPGSPGGPGYPGGPVAPG